MMLKNSHMWIHHNKMELLKEKNKHLLEVTQTHLFQIYVPKSYWCKVVLTIAHLNNRLPSRVIEG